MRKLKIANSNNTTLIFKGEVPATDLSFAIDFFKNNCKVFGYNNRVYVKGNSNLPLSEIKKQLEPTLGTQITIQQN